MEASVAVELSTPLLLDRSLGPVAEIEKVLGGTCASAANPSQYWHKAAQSGSSLTLGEMAKKYLCAPATSVESERLFSTTALTLTDLRKSMTVENLQKLLILICNVPLEECFAAP
ncbi:hypothetical protein L596_001733 [Steinernema carpocapsae]|uniref:HAT C-terminal dimerisation domain-containing protein n=1 Tax=Steinernema carpocapsae TaxID=34508 RepID=A0A4U8UMM0_STECR|nr:hypothetical protein L596_001733 [Steinernema carpocapsae]